MYVFLNHADMVFINIVHLFYQQSLGHLLVLILDLVRVLIPVVARVQDHQCVVVDRDRSCQNTYTLF